MSFNLGDRVRVSSQALGERTGETVRGRLGTVVDQLQAGDRPAEEPERLMVRFHRHNSVVFFDWIAVDQLREF